jgi:hypothetical protein
MFKIALGQIGRTGGEHTTQVNKDIAAFIPFLERYLESGNIKPLAYVVANDGKAGFESVLKGLEEFNTKKSDGKKLVVRVSPDRM